MNKGFLIALSELAFAGCTNDAERLVYFQATANLFSDVCPERAELAMRAARALLAVDEAAAEAAKLQQEFRTILSTIDAEDAQ